MVIIIVKINIRISILYKIHYIMRIKNSDGFWIKINIHEKINDLIKVEMVFRYTESHFLLSEL